MRSRAFVARPKNGKARRCGTRSEMHIEQMQKPPRATQTFVCDATGGLCINLYHTGVLSAEHLNHNAAKNPVNRAYPQKMKGRRAALRDHLLRICTKMRAAQAAFGSCSVRGNRRMTFPSAIGVAVASAGGLGIERAYRSAMQSHVRMRPTCACAACSSSFVACSAGSPEQVTKIGRGPVPSQSGLSSPEIIEASGIRV